MLPGAELVVSTVVYRFRNQRSHPGLPNAHTPFRVPYKKVLRPENGFEMSTEISQDTKSIVLCFFII